MEPTAPKPTGLDLMRAPFEPHQISTMCRSTKKDNQKGKCNKCGGYHGLPAVQLDYVGHAAVTDRLLDADPAWSWEPLALGADGYPVIDRDGGMWIKLTVCGVTRLGYGDAQGKTGGDAMKERIGDALRNAAMRFGAALELWHKGELHVQEEEHKEQQNGATTTEKTTTGKSTAQQSMPKEELDAFLKSLKGAKDVKTLGQLYRNAKNRARETNDIKAAQEIDDITSDRKSALEAAAAVERTPAPVTEGDYVPE